MTTLFTWWRRYHFDNIMPYLDDDFVHLVRSVSILPRWWRPDLNDTILIHLMTSLSIRWCHEALWGHAFPRSVRLLKPRIIFHFELLKLNLNYYWKLKNGIFTMFRTYGELHSGGHSRLAGRRSQVWGPANSPQAGQRATPGKNRF